MTDWVRLPGPHEGDPPGLRLHETLVAHLAVARFAMGRRICVTLVAITSGPIALEAASSGVLRKWTATCQHPSSPSNAAQAASPASKLSPR